MLLPFFRPSQLSHMTKMIWQQQVPIKLWPTTPTRDEWNGCLVVPWWSQTSCRTRRPPVLGGQRHPLGRGHSMHLEASCVETHWEADRPAGALMLVHRVVASVLGTTILFGSYQCQLWQLGKISSLLFPLILNSKQHTEQWKSTVQDPNFMLRPNIAPPP